MLPPERRKEAISWKTHFPGVANVVKVIWFRFRISVARELPSSTRLGFVQTHHVCTILKSVMVISSLMNQLVMAHSIPIAAGGNKGVSINTCHACWFQLSSHGTYEGGKRQRAFSCLLPLSTSCYAPNVFCRGRYWLVGTRHWGPVGQHVVCWWNYLIKSKLCAKMKKVQVTHSLSSSI